MNDLEDRLRAHLGSVANAAVPAERARPVAVSAEVAGHPGAIRVGRSLTAAVCGLALAVGAVVYVQQRDGGRSPLAVQTSTLDDRPGFILTNLPAGFDKGTRPKLLDPENLAPDPAPAGFELEFRQTKGPGRLRIVRAISPAAPTVNVTVGLLIDGVRRSVRKTGNAKLIAFPVGSGAAQIIATDVDDGALVQFAEAVRFRGGIPAVSQQSVPVGWVRTEPVPASQGASTMATVTYRNGAQLVSVAWPGGDHWPIGEELPYRVVGRGAQVVRVKDTGSMSTFLEAYVDIDGTVARVRSRGISEAGLVGLARAARRASGREWAEMARSRAVSVGSEVVVGRIARQGRLDGHVYRIMATDQLVPYGRPGFVSGLVGVVGASAFAVAEPSSSSHLDSGSGPDVLTVSAPTDDRPTIATLSLDDKPDLVAHFLPAVPGLSVRYAFLVANVAGGTGRLTVTSGDPADQRVVVRAVVRDGWVFWH